MVGRYLMHAFFHGLWWDLCKKVFLSSCVKMLSAVFYNIYFFLAPFLLSFLVYQFDACFLAMISLISVDFQSQNAVMVLPFYLYMSTHK